MIDARFVHVSKNFKGAADKVKYNVHKMLCIMENEITAMHIDHAQAVNSVGCTCFITNIPLFSDMARELDRWFTGYIHFSLFFLSEPIYVNHEWIQHSLSVLTYRYVRNQQTTETLVSGLLREQGCAKFGTRATHCISAYIKYGAFNRCCMPDLSLASKVCFILQTSHSIYPSP